MKYVTYGPRQFDTVSGIVSRLPDISDSSFPSGHALIVSIGAVFALNKFKGRKAKVIAVLLAIEAAIVCYSRIYLGLHYPLDVLGALFLASSIVFVGLFVIERYFAELIQRAAKLADRVIHNFRIPEFPEDIAMLNFRTSLPYLSLPQKLICRTDPRSEN
jgi:membrane-associated phospholipid phosphatase